MLKTFSGRFLIPIACLHHAIDADDDQDDRYFFNLALKGPSFRTLLSTVKDGEMLVKYLANNLEKLPDVLVLDVNMPRKNGYECLLQIKKDTPAGYAGYLVLQPHFTRLLLTRFTKEELIIILIRKTWRSLKQ